MPENYYDDGAAESPESQQPGPSNNQKTALVPKDFLPADAQEPDSTFTVRVVRLHDTEAEVEVTEQGYGGPPEEEQGEMSGPPPEAGMGMGGMME